MPPPNPISTRLKIQLKLSVSRLRHVQQKETAVSKQSRREIAQLLSSGKDESARIRVENVIRQEITVDLLEILELYCELLLARISLIDSRRDCDPSLVEAVKSIIYSAPRTDVKELVQVRDIFIMKYGKEFARDAIDSPETSVAPRVYSKLVVDPPSAELVTAYLEEIARTYRVPWSGLPEEERKKFESNHDDNDDDDTPSGGLALPSAPMTASAVPNAPIAASTASGQAGQAGQSGQAQKQSLPDFDELSRRFAALKR
ncbi:regulator of Vps4 activity in the MVB pathway-domain-containing protein [Lipomyces arxii]|uniref:regulator of Vps4 activity in the MVB pathway-domain-containing protein n=1 Tax=Lipomyces arxii TaxID=56418 RepID=UPI0034CE87BB